MTESPNPSTTHADSAARELSPAGVHRREAMLGNLLLQMHGVHRTRRTRRRVLVVAAPVILAALALVIVMHWPFAPVNAPRIAVGRAPAPKGIEAPSPKQPPATIIVMSDQDLLKELASLNRPAGLVRTRERVWLTQPVTDDALRERGSS